MSSIGKVLLVVALLSKSAAVHAQTARTLLGCYDVDVTRWQPSPPADSIQFVPPTRIRIDSARTGRDVLHVSPAPGAMPSAHTESFALDDEREIKIVWTTGYHGARATVQKSGNNLRGVLETFVDYSPAKDYKADVLLTRVSCNAALPASRRYRERYSPSVALAKNTVTIGRKPPVPLTPFIMTAARVVLQEKPVGVYAGADSVRLLIASDSTVRGMSIFFPGNAAFDKQLARMTAQLGVPSARGTSEVSGGQAQSASWASRTLLISLLRIVAQGRAEMYVLYSDPRKH